MPAEIFDADEFLALSEKAIECRVKRFGETMKLKLRTPSRLYTIKLDKSKGEEILGKIKCAQKEF